MPKLNGGHKARDRRLWSLRVRFAPQGRWNVHEHKMETCLALCNGLFDLLDFDFTEAFDLE